MEMKNLLSVIDTLEAKNTVQEIVQESTQNELSKYMELILEENGLDEKKHFHYTGHSSSLSKDLKRTHGLKKSVRKSSRHGAKHYLKDETNPVDSVTMDIPLLIRILEYAREDANSDMDLHSITERMIEISENGELLTMDQYDAIVGGQESPE